MDDCGHDVQDLRLSCIKDISIIIQQNSFEKRRYHVYTDHLQIICFLNVSVDKFKYLLFYRPESSNPGCFGRNIAYRMLAFISFTEAINIIKGGGPIQDFITIMGNSVTDKLARGSKHVQHVMIDPANLGVEVSANRGACGDICLHNISDDLDRLGILKNRRVLIRLSYDGIPSRVR